MGWDRVRGKAGVLALCGKEYMSWQPAARAGCAWCRVAGHVSACCAVRAGPGGARAGSLVHSVCSAQSRRLSSQSSAAAAACAALITPEELSGAAAGCCAGASGSCSASHASFWAASHSCRSFQLCSCCASKRCPCSCASSCCAASHHCCCSATSAARLTGQRGRGGRGSCLWAAGFVAGCSALRPCWACSRRRCCRNCCRPCWKSSLDGCAQQLDTTSVAAGLITAPMSCAACVPSRPASPHCDSCKHPPSQGGMEGRRHGEARCCQVRGVAGAAMTVCCEEQGKAQPAMAQGGQHCVPTSPGCDLRVPSSRQARTHA